MDATFEPWGTPNMDGRILLLIFSMIKNYILHMYETKVHM